MARVCLKCGKELSKHYPANYCEDCQQKQLEKMIADGEDLVDAESYAAMLGLYSAEQLKRLARKDVLASRIPYVRQWLWRRKVIEDWFKQKQREGDVFRKTAMGIASNLRVCNNNVILRAMSYTVGNEVYGQEYALATKDAARIDELELVEVDRSTALKILEDLPKKDFPELEGLADWKDTSFDKIHENLLVRLESYF